MRFHKYHALGNDYLVLEPSDAPTPPSPEAVRRICHRNFGLGSDGILYGPLPTASGAFGLRIYNPDGSEAEKSGNGLRIFARHLRRTGRVGPAEFRVETPGGTVSCQVPDGGRPIRVEMGRASFRSTEIPVTGSDREVLGEELFLEGRAWTFCAATVGNPHCVLPLPEVDAALAHRLGPQIETHPLFPRRTNVQFLQILDRANLRIEIWERGAGYTLASGSSSCAASAVAYRLGLVDAQVTVHMPGGRLQIAIAPDYALTMSGPATHVGEMILDPEALAE